jgi:hypothetical protein
VLRRSGGGGVFKKYYSSNYLPSKPQKIIKATEKLVHTIDEVGVDAKNDNHDTALMLALIQEKPKVAMALLNMGADPNIPGMKNQTPLMKAAENGYPDVVKLLLDKDAEKDAGLKISEKDVAEALTLAIDARHTETIKSKIIELLKGKGAPEEDAPEEDAPEEDGGE